MIWHSILATTVVDMLMVSFTSCTLWVLYKREDSRREPRALSGTLLIAMGVVLFDAFFAFDLLTMHGLPLFIPREDTIAVMGDLHLDLSWLVALAGMGSIVAGFLLNNKHIFLLVGRLARTKGRLVEEIVERNKVEQALRESEERDVRPKTGFRIDEIV